MLCELTEKVAGECLRSQVQFNASAAKSLQSCLTLCDPQREAHQASPSMGFSREEHWSGLQFPSPIFNASRGKQLKQAYCNCGPLQEAAGAVNSLIKEVNKNIRNDKTTEQNAKYYPILGENGHIC